MRVRKAPVGPTWKPLCADRIRTLRRSRSSLRVPVETPVACESGDGRLFESAELDVARVHPSAQNRSRLRGHPPEWFRNSTAPFPSSQPPLEASLRL
jgi:hypothetical protein